MRDQDYHHWFNMYAVRDRVQGLHLPDDQPTAAIAALPLGTFLPNVEVCVTFHSDCAGWQSVDLVPSMVQSYKTSGTKSYSSQVHWPHGYKVWNNECNENENFYLTILLLCIQ